MTASGISPINAAKMAQAPVTHARLLGRTLPEGFYRRVQAHPDRDLFLNKKDGRWVATTYRQAFEYMGQTVSGLKALGFQPGEKVCILAENREEWILTDYAAQVLGGCTTAIYSTSTPDQILYLLDDSETVVLFVSNIALLRRMQSIKKFKTVKTIVVWDDPEDFKCPDGVQLLRKADFLKPRLSETEFEAYLPRIREDDLCCLLYTSGTTGEPKGVMLTHSNIVSDLAAMLRAVPGVSPEKKTISFLPLSHIYERCLHNLWVQVGIRIHFAESLDKLIDNLQEVRPEIMTAVPRIFEKMYGKIQEKMKNSSDLQKRIFNAAMSVGKQAFQYLYYGKRLPLHLAIAFKFFDLLVFKKIRAITGGRAELFISGGAPLSAEIAEFFYFAGFVILEGYGLSESCILSVNPPGRVKIGSVGPAFQSIEYKIDPDGEICVRSPTIMLGYYRKEVETAEVIDAQGWFHTGDIGELDADGYLKITDRKKDLIVTAGGKKVAPQPIENALKADPLIEGVCLLGDQKKYVVALIVPNLELCRSWGQVKGETLNSMEDCALSKGLEDHFRKEIEKVNQELPKYSTIKDFRLLKAAFSMEGGELTPTLKLKRRVIQARHQAVIESMYPTE